MTRGEFEDVWRREWPHVLGALLRRHGDLGECEDAAQEALEAAARQWPDEGVPDSPRGWLTRVASRRLIDQSRSTRARTARETAEARRQPADAEVVPAADSQDLPASDDTLQLLLMCCHPALTRPTQVALTLSAVSGLTTPQIAAAFLVPPSTMAQRLSRARSTLRSAAVRFELPSPAELPPRVAAVLGVLYLLFNEGYTQSSGDTLVNASPTSEAIRLTRGLWRRLPDHDEVAGALALMLLTQSRHVARVTERGDLIPLAEQDRRRWDGDLIAEGVAILEAVLPHGHVGPYQVQAAIAAVHAESPTWADSDWLQIHLLYDKLHHLDPSPTVSLNRAVAVSMTFGPHEALAIVDRLLDDPALRRHHRAHAVRAHLLETIGDLAAAADGYARAAALTSSAPEQRYLHARARRALGQPWLSPA